MTRGALLVALAAIACHDRAASSVAGGAPRTTTVKRGEIRDRVLLTGNLHAAGGVALTVPRTETWELSIRWMAEDGTPVKAGDRVVEFDNSSFTAKLEEKRLAALEAKTDFRSAQDVAAIDLADKAAQLEQNKVALEKAAVLADVPADLLPARTAQERKLDRTRADAAVAKAKREVDSARDAGALETRVKQLALDKAVRAVESAEQTIGELVLKAPRDGLVAIGQHPWAGRKFEVDDPVQPGWAIAELPDASAKMEVLAELSDVDDGRVAVGATGTCTLDAYPDEPVACEVTDVSPVARQRPRVNVVSRGTIQVRQSLRRSFAVKLSLARSDVTRMRSGMSVKVEIDHAPVKALVVARGAIVVDGKTARAELASGATRDVTVGACDAQQCAIESGLADGDVVVMEPTR